MTNFIDFCAKEQNNIMSAIKLSSSNIPSCLNSADFRFNISHFICHTLTEMFGTKKELKFVFGNGYDILYNDTVKISVKIQQEIFQHNKNNGELSVPKKIVVKNCLGENVDINDIDLDYVLLIQRGMLKSTNRTDIGFGVLSKESLYKNNINVFGDQIIVNVENKYLDYYSGLYNNYVNIDDKYQKKLNSIFIRNMKRTFNSILTLK